MRIIAKAALAAFWMDHPDAEQPLKAWHDEASKATWTAPQQIKAQYRSASIRPDRRIVFNIKGNDYRLVVAIAFKSQVIYVKFIGTHAQYDRVDVDTVELE